MRTDLLTHNKVFLMFFTWYSGLFIMTTSFYHIVFFYNIHHVTCPKVDIPYTNQWVCFTRMFVYAEDSLTRTFTRTEHIFE